MICDPAVAEMFGLRDDPPVAPTQSIYCLDGVPRAEPRLSVDVDTWTWTETSPYSLTPAADNSFTNTTGRPMEVALFFDVKVSVDWETAAAHQAGLICTYTLSVTTFPSSSQPVYPPFSGGDAVYPALTISLTPESSLDGSDMEDESFSGRAQGFLPPLAPGWTYLMRPDCSWSLVLVSSILAYSGKVYYSALRWNATD